VKLPDGRNRAEVPATATVTTENRVVEKPIKSDRSKLE
jgi:hypothetical protein